MSNEHLTRDETAGTRQVSAVRESAGALPSNGDRPSVLVALVNAGGSLPVAELVRCHGGAVAVARASTSRTLRRLWRAGLVDLFEKHGAMVDRRRTRGLYVTRVAITASGVTAVKSHGAMSVNREVETAHDDA